MVKNNNKKIEDLDFLDGIPLAVALPEDSTLPDPGRLMYYDGLKNRTLYMENEIEREYLRFLNSKDSQVFFEDTEEYERKPHLGIVVGINGMKYCIPLTSAKPGHLGWANVSKHNIVIYEKVDKSEIHRKDV